MKEFLTCAQPAKILIAEEEENDRIMLSQMVEKMGLYPISVLDGRAALDEMNRQKLIPDLFLVNIKMPGMNGLELCDVLKRNVITRDIPVIFLSESHAVEDKVRCFNLGGVDYIEKPFVSEEVTVRIRIHLGMYQMQKEQENCNRRLNHIVSEQIKQLAAEKKNILYALARLSDRGANFLGNHMVNVSANSRLLAQALQLCPDFEREISNSFIETIEVAAMLHDIGKLTVPHEILHKPDRLDEEEKRLVKSHAESGARILAEIYSEIERNEYVKMAIEIARYHHENWDGSGYPYGLKGNDIPLAARIVALTGAFDTLTGERCYKKALPSEESMEILKADSGKAFDPALFAIFFKIRRHLKSDFGGIDR